MSANTELVQRIYDAIGRGDVPAFLSGLDPQVEWTEAEGFRYAGTYVGPDAVLSGVVGRLATEWDGFQAVLNELIDAGEQVVGLGRYRGTYKATGMPMDAAFAHIFDLRDGKLIKFRQYVDSALVQDALRN